MSAENVSNPVRPTVIKPPTTPAGHGDAPKPSRATVVDGTNPSLWVTALMGVAMTTVFYLAAVYPLKSIAPQWYELLAERTKIVHATVLLFFWAEAILVQKYMKLRRQRQVLAMDLLPGRLPNRVTAETVDVYCKHLNSLGVKPGESFLMDRVLRALEHFRARRSVQEAGHLVTTQGDLDLSTVLSSYSMLGVLTWAVPILGFIGTVYGIGQSVTGFRATLEHAENLEAIKSGLTDVTTGLAIAFDTTLIALVLSLFIVFPSRGMQKAEEDMLGQIDDFCVETLLPRLEDGGNQQNQMVQMIAETVKAAMPSKDWAREIAESVKAAMTGREWVQEAVQKAMVAQEAEFKNWTRHLQEAGGRISEQIVQGWSTVGQQFKEGQAEHVQAVKDVMGTIAAERQAFVEQVKGVQSAQVQQLHGTVGSMSELIGRVSREIAELQGGQARGFQDVVGKLASDLRSIQTQGKEQHAADVGAIQNMAKSFVQTLQEMREQAGATQSGWSAQIAQYGAEVSRRVIEGWEQVNEQLSETHGRQLGEVQKVLNAVSDERKEFLEQVQAVHAAQMQQGAEMLRAMGETAARVQREIAALQENQVRGLREAVTGIGGELRNVREQAAQQHAGDAEGLNRMVTSFADSLRNLREQVAGTQRDMAENLKGTGGAVREELRRVAGELSEAFRGQMQNLDQVRKSAEEAANKFAENLEKMRAAHSDGMRATVDALREGVRTSQQDFVNAQAESARKLADLGANMAEQARAAQRDMESMRTMLGELVRNVGQQTDRMRETSERSGKELLTQLSATAQSILTSMSEGMKSVQERLSGAESSRIESLREQFTEMKREREEMVRGTADQLGKIQSMGKDLVASMNEGQRKLGEQLVKLAEVMREADKLGQVQEALASNLHVLATTDAFKDALTGIDRGLNHLHPVLKDLSDRAGILYENPEADDHKRGAVSRMWKKVTGGSK